MKKFRILMVFCTLMGVGSGIATGKMLSSNALLHTSQKVQSTSIADSIRVEQLLESTHLLPADSSRTLHFAKQLLGVPYVAHTLDQVHPETLTSRLDALDCTTFVETVVALTMTEREGIGTWQRFRKNLECIRYRNGICNGYASRLHYFSDWIADNEQKGWICERTHTFPQSVSASLNLNYMSSHAESYPILKQYPSELKRIIQVEQTWRNRTIACIPKSQLNMPATELDIHNGDILAITTSIQGLDVVHVGFAVWVKGCLHLLHASSKHKKVMLDSLSLFEYSRNKKLHTGIRVISVCSEER